MKAPAFRYLKPATLEDCLEALAEHGDDAQVLAGGQSLVAMLNLRLAGPAVVVDIGALHELRTISQEERFISVGALATHAAIAGSELIKQHVPLLSQAAPHIAHVAIRSRGTIGGSVALADPAGEWPACCLALDAEVVLASSKGTRRVRAVDFFLGLYTTERRADELLTAVRFPTAGNQRFSAFDEVCRRRGDFAIAGLALTYGLAGMSLVDPRLALFGVADRPVLAGRTSELLEGAKLDRAQISAARQSLDAELDPPEDPAYPADYRRRVAQVLLERTLTSIAAGADHAG